MLQRYGGSSFERREVEEAAEFRRGCRIGYAIAGLICVSEILRRLNRLEEEQTNFEGVLSLIITMVKIGNVFIN